MLRIELVNQFGLEQIVLEPAQHRLLQHVAPDRQPIVAGPPIAGVGAAVVPRANERVAAAAGAAGEQTGKQVMRPACALRPYAPVAHYGLSRRRLACLHGRPQVVADNAQGGDILDDPFFLRIWAGPAANHLGVLDEPLAVPDEAPDVELVVQYSCAAPPVAVDRRRPPGIAPGPWYAPVI